MKIFLFVVKVFLLLIASHCWAAAQVASRALPHQLPRRLPAFPFRIPRISKKLDDGLFVCLSHCSQRSKT